MIDHLLQFASEADARKVLPDYWRDGDAGEPRPVYERVMTFDVAIGDKLPDGWTWEDDEPVYLNAEPDIDLYGYSMSGDRMTVYLERFVGTEEVPSNPGAWRGDCCIPGVSVYRVTGTEEVQDPEAGHVYEREIREPYDGWFLTISLSDLDKSLIEYCWLATDRDAAERGDKFVLYSTVPDDELAVFRAEPCFAGNSVPDRMAEAPKADAAVEARQDWAKAAMADEL